MEKIIVLIAFFLSVTNCYALDNVYKWHTFYGANGSDSGHAIAIDSMNPKLLNFSFPWVETSTYKLTIFPKGIKGINGKWLQDTLARKIVVTHKDQLGNILLTLQPPDLTKQYVLKLMQNKKEVAQVILPPGATKAEWDLMLPGEYSVELIEDDRANGFWDPGNYLKAQQPERIFVKTLEKLRANWDLEISWNPLNKPAPKEDEKATEEKTEN